MFSDNAETLKQQQKKVRPFLSPSQNFVILVDTPPPASSLRAHVIIKIHSVTQIVITKTFFSLLRFSFSKQIKAIIKFWRAKNRITFSGWPFRVISNSVLLGSPGLIQGRPNGNPSYRHYQANGVTGDNFHHYDGKMPSSPLVGVPPHSLPQEHQPHNYSNIQVQK